MSEGSLRLNPEQIHDRVREFKSTALSKRKLRLAVDLDRVRNETAKRLESGYVMIKNTKEPSDLEVFWCGLLEAYESVCDALDELPDQKTMVEVIFDATEGDD